MAPADLPAAQGWIRAALAPRVIAVIGASAEPDKIGGRPLKYLLRHGYAGTVFPVNPQRAEVQGLKTWPTLEALPETPDLAVIAVPGRAAVEAVEQCAKRGVRVAVVMSSGFAETGAEGRALQERMRGAALATDMRLVGPNTQGIANFATGAIASFATMIGEIPPADGPVAIVSQSGAMSMVPYAALRTRGIGVRHSHATGNEADLGVADFVAAVALDAGVRLILLYVESLADPAALEAAAAVAFERGIPIVALKAGVSARGQAAASSHTGALATEDRVVDAFFQKLGIWRAPDMRSLCNAAPLYLAGLGRPRGRRVVAISNSGASCVMAADAAERFGVVLEPFDQSLQARVEAVLPSFAASANPVDLTAALLTDSSLLGKVLPLVGEAADGFFVSLPMSGQGYDVARFARDTAGFMQGEGKPVVFASPLPRTRETFQAAGVPVFEHDVDAMEALAQFLCHGQREAPEAGALPSITPPVGAGFISEAESLALVAAHGVPVVAHRLCRTQADAIAALAALGGPVAVKGCSPSVPHKSEHGLVHLGLSGPARVALAAQMCLEKLAALGARDPSVLVARMVHGRRELVAGARWMPGFGAVAMFGDGGRDVEAVADVRLLVFPFGAAHVREQLEALRVAPLLRAHRGEPAIELSAFCVLVVTLARLVAAARGRIASADLNPVLVGPRADDTVVADALVELSAASPQEDS